MVLQFVRWYPILTWSDYEKEYYDDFFDEMVEIFGEDNVHGEVPIAHGSTLKIDFHIGHPQNGGVGVEFKLPTNNNELQRALGQMDQYLTRYGSNLIVVLIPHLLKSTEAVLFRETLDRKGVENDGVTIQNISTGHSRKLGPDNIREFRSDKPGAGPHFLLLRCQLILDGRAILLEPIHTPS